MFEAVLEWVLLKYLGRFIQGLDTNCLHVGVWSGNVVIENVSLRPDVLEMLGLPLQVKYSNVGRL
jgi:vacuolar protein sorting-associated protein 13A/C